MQKISSVFLLALCFAGSLDAHQLSLVAVERVQDYISAWECKKCHRWNLDQITACPYCGRKRG